MGNTVNRKRGTVCVLQQNKDIKKQTSVQMQQKRERLKQREGETGSWWAKSSSLVVYGVVYEMRKRDRGQG